MLGPVAESAGCFGGGKLSRKLNRKQRVLAAVAGFALSRDMQGAFAVYSGLFLRVIQGSFLFI